MATVLEAVIVPALKEIGVLAASETGTTEDAADALAALNRMLDQWAAERLQIFTVTRTTWVITAGIQNYNVGVGQVVNVARPVYVDHVNFQDTAPDPDLEYQMEPLTEDAWSRVPQKTLQSKFPTSWYYNPTFPNAVLTLWPIPTATTLQGVLYAPQAVAQFAALTTVVSLPPGYEEMLVKNLALKLGPSYERQPNPVLVEQAREAKAIVKRANKRLADLSIDDAALIQGRNRRFYYSLETGP